MSPGMHLQSLICISLSSLNNMKSIGVSAPPPLFYVIFFSLSYLHMVFTGLSFLLLHKIQYSLSFPISHSIRI